MHNPFNEVDNWRDESDDSAYGPLPIVFILVSVTLMVAGAIWAGVRVL